MEKLFSVEWSEMFTPTISLLEIVLRGTIIYLVLFLIMRFLRREAGGLGIADVLVIVLIADAAQNAMSSDYKSITEGVVLVGTIVLWDYLLDWLAFRFPGIRRIVRPAPLRLVEDGRMNRRNMRQEMISKDELMGFLREQGVDDLADVKSACMEGDGHISVIKKEKQEDDSGGEGTKGGVDKIIG